ncbi:VOC family protein [Temperatibacter marinus]|uniref:VOC family protein n=1 Tax=Temperatibacter marinus TaxID=1456591 RepID=A0AA52H9M8_9PROT|nr:VOC family protein [Temperatibacter marinus]WND01778.1 VOC family protein [Temperatibacter marinus]
MIGYTTLGTNDLQKSSAFYDALMAELGAKRIMDDGNFIVWGSSLDKPGFSITAPFDGKTATVGNGTMIALTGESNAHVDAVYKKALELGATCEGGPGDRGVPGMNFYAAYFRDLDGNKLNCFCTTGE